MGTPAPDAARRPVDHLDQDRKVFLTLGQMEEQLPTAKTPHEQESLQRLIVATDRLMDALVHERCGLTDGEVRIVEGGVA